MGLYTALVSNVLFPLQERLKKHDTVAIRSGMEDSQWWPSEKLEELRLERLRTLLSKAGKHVPYYCDCFSQLGFDPHSIRSLADLQKMPFLTKAVIRAEGDRMKSEIAKGLARFNTGGSSGEPLIFFIGNERVSHDVAAKWRATRWWGVDIGDPEIVVWGSPIELSAQDRLRQWRDRLMRTQLLPAFQMSEAKLDEFIATITSTRPRVLFGYPSSISLLARHAEKRGQSMSNLGIKVAFVTSERLYEEQRDAISRVFGCLVANGYGGRDAGFIAHECPAGGMHLTAEDIIVEIVDRDGHVLAPGQVGEIVVTHLATSDFPFIRYQTGDMGALSARLCGCGRGLPVLEEIQGRTTDFVVAADGTVMHGLALIYPIRDLPGVAAFKVIQHSLNHTEVQIVANGDYSLAVANDIQSGIQARLGKNVTVDVQKVEAIQPERSGKFRYIVSHVPLP